MSLLTNSEDRHSLQCRNTHREGVRARTAAHQAYSQRETASRAETKLVELKAGHVEWHRLHYQPLTEALLLCLLPATAWAVDYVLLGIVAEDFAALSISNPGWLAVVKLIVPAALIWVELVASMQLAAMRKRRLDKLTTYRDSLGALLAATLGVLFVPCSAVAVSLISSEGFSEPVRDLKLVALVALSLFIHVMVMSCGAKVVEAWSMLRFSRNVGSLDREIHQLKVAARASMHLAAASFEAYAHSLAQLRTDHPNTRFNPLFFDAHARQIINEGLGYDAIAAPGSGNTQDSALRTEPTGTPGGTVNPGVPAPPLAGPNPPARGQAGTTRSATDEIREEESEVRV